jgi:hypothetical protein
MVSLGDNHLIRFLVSDYGITWTEMRDDRELMKLEGAEAINQLEELATLVKKSLQKSRDTEYSSPTGKRLLQKSLGRGKTQA